MKFRLVENFDGYKKGDKVELPNGQTGTVEDDYNLHDDRIKVSIDGVNEIKFPLVDTVKPIHNESLKETLDMSLEELQITADRYLDVEIDSLMRLILRKTDNMTSGQLSRLVKICRKFYATLEEFAYNNIAESFSRDFESRDLQDTGELISALKELIKQYGHMELEKEVYLETVENDHGRQLKIGFNVDESLTKDTKSPVDLPGTINERLQTGSSVQDINDLAARIEKILRINYPTVLVKSDDQENGRIAVMHDNINKQASVKSWCDTISRSTYVKPKSYRIVNSHNNNGTYAIVFTGISCVDQIRIKHDDVPQRSSNHNVSSAATKYGTLMMEASLNDSDNKRAHNLDEDVFQDLTKKINEMNENARKYIYDRLTDFYMPNEPEKDRKKITERIFEKLKYFYREMFDFIPYWGGGEEAADNMWDEGVDERITELIGYENFPEEIIKDIVTDSGYIIPDNN
jgi:hypothetical protein